MTSRRWLVIFFLAAVVHNALRAAAAILGVRGPYLLRYVGSYSRVHLDFAGGAQLAVVVAAAMLAFGVGVNFWRRTTPTSAFTHSSLWAMLSGALLGSLAVAVSTQADRTYGWALFVLVPFAVGLHAALALSWQKAISRGDAVVVSLAAVLLLGAILIAAAIEGFICLVMAAPLAIPLAMLGGLAGYALRHRPALQNPAMFLLMAGLLPSSATLERAATQNAAVFETTSSMDIAASPDRVWRTVLQPAKLRPPSDALFRAGIAYPRESHIEGSGLNAIRYCDFSTGKLVEPVLIWEDRHRLRFTVVSNPLPMQEWTPYAHIHPPHLEGFLVSRQGEFRLDRLPNGGTRLFATTWYQHHLAPSAYWLLWSDKIIHEVHAMVLANIRERAEGG
jgi:hypothetical protein